MEPPVAKAQPVPIGSPFRINTYTPGGQEDASVASDREGNFVVVWQSDERVVSGRRFDASGSPMGGEFVVTGQPLSHANPRVASHGDGSFVVVWSDKDEDPPSGNHTTDGIFARRFDASGSPLGTRFRVNTYTPHPQYLPDIAAHDGGFIAVWAHFQAIRDWHVMAKRFDAAGVPLAEEFQVDEVYDPAYLRFPDRPSVASTDGGDFVVAWASVPGPRGLTREVFGQRYDSAGDPLGRNFLINTYTTGFQDDAEIATDADGRFVVAWDQAGSNSSIVARLFDAQGNPLTGELNASLTGSSQSEHAVSFVEDGFVVVWHKNTPFIGTRDTVGRYFSSSGQAVGDEFQIGSSTGGHELGPRVAPTSEHQFVVVWDGGPGEDIWGQLFSVPALTLTVDGSCPGPVTVDVSSAPSNSEVALIAAANTNGFTKGGALCDGTQLEIGEPFQLPPQFVIVDGNGNGSTNLTLGANRCHLQALALASCQTSNVVEVP
jgi:hypothetical protein